VSESVGGKKRRQNEKGMARINVKYTKSRATEYHVFRDGCKLKKRRREYDFPENTVVVLVEKNVVLDPCWWFLIAVDLIMAFFGGGGGGDIFDDTPPKRRRITLRLGKSIGGMITVLISKDGTAVADVQGVENYAVLDTETENCPLVTKRIKTYKKWLVITMLSLLTAVLLFIAISIIKKES
jgi:hypothetical protein